MTSPLVASTHLGASTTPPRCQPVESGAVPPTILPLGPDSNAVSANLAIGAPFDAVRALFDHLHENPHAAAQLNATYPHRGIIKTAAQHKTASDQKFTIDLSPSRLSLIPDPLKHSLAPHGFNDILDFFGTLSAHYVPAILSSLSVLAGTDLEAAHKTYTMNWRLCDYNPDTAAPESANGCGAHTDYGTFSIIFQDGHSGLELEDSNAQGTWTPVPGDATVILTGWCAVILSGGRISAARHRVRRAPGVRRLSAVLFLAPDKGVQLKPLDGVHPVRRLSDRVMQGELDVDSFKEMMGKRWRYREGNEEMEDGDAVTQDDEIEKLVWA